MSYEALFGNIPPHAYDCNFKVYYRSYNSNRGRHGKW